MDSPPRQLLCADATPTSQYGCRMYSVADMWLYLFARLHQSGFRRSTSACDHGCYSSGTPGQYSDLAGGTGNYYLCTVVASKRAARHRLAPQKSETCW